MRKVRLLKDKELGGARWFKFENQGFYLCEADAGRIDYSCHGEWHTLTITPATQRGYAWIEKDRAED